jgi:predicted RNA methylase
MTWSSLDLAGHCRADIDRTVAFEKALRRAVSPKDVVLDIGAGSGILSVLALRCGARRVIAVESDVDRLFFSSPKASINRVVRLNWFARKRPRRYYRWRICYSLNSLTFGC